MRAEIFKEVQPELVSLARRMLGSNGDAEDMVHEACLRWERAATDGVRSPKAFLTTIVTRLCLNHLDLARVRLEHEDAPLLLENLSSQSRNPAEHAEFTDSLSEALGTVLGTLPPTERVVFLMREAFEFDYADIALVVDRSEENCRQILRRARERLAAREPSTPAAREQDQRIVSEFLNAVETGQIDQLVQLLSESATLAPAPADLSQPAPPLIDDRDLLIQTLRNSLAQMRADSERFVHFPIGQYHAGVACRGTAAQGAILLRFREQKVANVRMVRCPALLNRLKILMTAISGGVNR